jgi:hypothetical protein
LKTFDQEIAQKLPILSDIIIGMSIFGYLQAMRYRELADAHR